MGVMDRRSLEDQLGVSHPSAYYLVSFSRTHYFVISIRYFVINVFMLEHVDGKEFVDFKF